jgi:hypothetical protein
MGFGTYMVPSSNSVDSYCCRKTWHTKESYLNFVRRWRLTGARHSQCSGAPNAMGPSLNWREGHDGPHLGLNLARETAARVHDGEVASSNLSSGGGSLWWSPDSKTQSNSFFVGSSPSSYAPITARSNKLLAHSGKLTLGFFGLWLKIRATSGLFIGDFSMDS